MVLLNLGDSMIKFENVSFAYDKNEKEKKALDDVSFEIKKGEFVSILGMNGSGKSTIAKIMDGILLPTEGDATVMGMNTKNEENLLEIRQNLGLVFQNPDNQIIATIVEEDVAFGPENLGLPTPEIRKRVDDALEIVSMTEYKKHAPNLLSGGQKQRLAIAGILAINPNIIVFDEPTAMLDPLGRKEVMDTIIKLNRQYEKTIVLITHFMSEAVLSDRLMVMHEGKLVWDDTPRRIFSDVKKVHSLGLDVPQVTELSNLLKEDGFDVAGDELSIDELVAKL